MRNTDHLMFTLYGPLSAWGGPAPGSQRPSSDHPGRSAILGLVAGALGVRHDVDEPHVRLEAGYGMAVRVDAPGTLMRDYHSTQTVKRTGKTVHPSRRSELDRDPAAVETMLSRRDYRSDGVWTVAIWRRNEAPHDLADIQHALRAPAFIPFLGRKSCPLGLPTQPEIVSAETLRDAYARYAPAHRRFLPEVAWAKTPAIFWSDHPAPGLEADYERTVRDVILSRVRVPRTFGTRIEFEARREVPPLPRLEEVSGST